MKKHGIGICVVLVASQLSACQPGDNVGGSTAVGAIAGGMLGSAFFHGSGQWAGILGGAVLGGIVGNKVGQSMDRQDRQNMQSAIVQTPVGQEASWENKQTGRAYRVRPVKTYRDDGRYCREFQTRIKIDAHWQQGYGKACRQPDGAWQIVK